MVKALKRKRAISSYMKKLPSLLQSRYGYFEYYTRRQVEQTILQSSLNKEYQDYAVAMFCDPNSNIADHDPSEDLIKIREYIATTYFGGNLGFSVVDIKSIVASGWFVEGGMIDSIVTGGSDDGGGFSDGGGGGGE